MAQVRADCDEASRAYTARSGPHGSHGAGLPGTTQIKGGSGRAGPAQVRGAPSHALRARPAPIRSRLAERKLRRAAPGSRQRRHDLCRNAPSRASTSRPQRPESRETPGSILCGGTCGRSFFSALNPTTPGRKSTVTRRAREAPNARRLVVLRGLGWISPPTAPCRGPRVATHQARLASRSASRCPGSDPGSRPFLISDEPQPRPVGPGTEAPPGSQLPDRPPHHRAVPTVARTNGTRERGALG